MNCRKCGAQLHPEQKVCIQCGAPTPAGGGFDVEEEQPWRPSRNMIYAAAGVLAVIIIVLVARSFRTVPAEVVAKEWFDAMAQRQIGKAERMVTRKFLDELASQNMNLLAIADEIYTRVNQDMATPSFGKPVYDVEDAPTTAEVTITLKPPQGPPSDTHLMLVKVGRQWRVDSIDRIGF